MKMKLQQQFAKSISPHVETVLIVIAMKWNDLFHGKNDIHLRSVCLVVFLFFLFVFLFFGQHVFFNSLYKYSVYALQRPMYAYWVGRNRKWKSKHFNSINHIIVLSVIVFVYFSVCVFFFFGSMQTNVFNKISETYVLMIGFKCRIGHHVDVCF